ncbi:uncharacterized protein [Apostichopus japonicus]
MPDMDPSESSTKLAPLNQKRVMLWAPPRSLSTAFERCLSTLMEEHNVTIFHEPFTTAYHLGPERQIEVPIPPLKFTVEESKYTYSWVKKQIEQEFRDSQVVFAKDLAYSVSNKMEYLPEGFQHTFLIRHPQKVFKSFHTLLHRPLLRLLRIKLSDILPQGWVFQEMYELYEYVTETLGQNVVIIDADDLVEHPEEVLEMYCKHTGIPYSPNMTVWGKGKDDLKRWHLSKRMLFVNTMVGQYDRALSTRGLGKPTHHPPHQEVELSGECQLAIQQSVPYYQKLYEKRMVPPSISGKKEEDECSEADEAEEREQLIVSGV